jgi:hypothetical protein
MKKGLVFLSIMITALMYNGCGDQGGTAAGTDQYVLESFAGDVKISHDAGKTWENALADMKLAENDVIRTGAKSYVDIVMPDRGIFRVSYDSEITLKKLSGGTENISVKKGKVAINVINKLNEKETFKVETESSVALVRGTEFVVEVTPADTTVAVKDGTVNMVENIEISVTDPALKMEIESALQVPVNSMEQAKLSKESSVKMEIALNTAIKDAKNKEDVLSAVQDVRKEYEVKKTPADEAMLNTDFAEINSDKKMKKYKEMSVSAKDKKALEDLGKGVGMGKTGDKVGDKSTTIEEDIKNKEVEKVMDKAAENSGMGKDGKKVIKDKVGDSPTSIQEDIQKDEVGGVMDKAKQNAGKKTTEPAPTDSGAKKPGSKGKNMLNDLGE